VSVKRAVSPAFAFRLAGANDLAQAGNAERLAVPRGRNRNLPRPRAEWLPVSYVAQLVREQTAAEQGFGLLRKRLFVEISFCIVRKERDHCIAPAVKRAYTGVNPNAKERALAFGALFKTRSGANFFGKNQT
jgi:hypothetical protein